MPPDLKEILDDLERDLDRDPIPADAIRILGQLVFALVEGQTTLTDIVAKLERKPRNVINYVNH